MDQTVSVRYSLSELTAGKTASIIALDGGRGFREKMNGQGLFPGTEITVVHTGGNGGMMLISLGSSRLMIGQKMAEKILIKEIV